MALLCRSRLCIARAARGVLVSRTGGLTKVSARCFAGKTQIDSVDGVDKSTVSTPSAVDSEDSEKGIKEAMETMNAMSEANAPLEQAANAAMARERASTAARDAAAETDAAAGDITICVPQEVSSAFTDLQALVGQGKHSEARAAAAALKSVCMSDEEGRDVGWLRRMQHKLSVLGAVGALVGREAHWGGADHRQYMLHAVNMEAIINEVNAADFAEGLRLADELPPDARDDLRWHHLRIKCLKSLERDAEALEAMHAAVPSVEAELEATTPAEAANFYHDVGMQHYHMYEYEQSVPWFERAHALFARHFGPDHATTNVARTNAAHNRQMAKQVAEIEREGGKIVRVGGAGKNSKLE